MNEQMNRVVPCLNSLKKHKLIGFSLPILLNENLLNEPSGVREKEKVGGKKSLYLMYVARVLMFSHDLSMSVLFNLDSCRHLLLLVIKEGYLTPEHFCAM